MMSTARNILDAQISEREFQAQIIHAAKANGWRVMHTRPAMRQSGSWSTPIQGHPGYPDLTLARDGRVIIAELKSMKGRLSAEQQAWIDAMARNDGVEVFVWRPDMWERILEVLA